MLHTSTFHTTLTGPGLGAVRSRVSRRGFRRLESATRPFRRAGSLVATLGIAHVERIWDRHAAPHRQTQPLSLTDRAAWVQDNARCIAGLLNLEIQSSGIPPRHGLIAANHLSYLDILALASVQPVLFVCKDEVRSWPGLGSLVAHGGTIFIRRGVRSDVHATSEAIALALAQGVPVVVFPEGTSSDGSRVLPFHSSLFQPAITHRCPVTPVGLSYSLPDGDGCTGDEVCYWGNHSFGPHLWKVLGKRRIRVELRFGASFTDVTGQRRSIARAAQAAVTHLLTNEGAPDGNPGDLVEDGLQGQGCGS